MEKKCKEQVVKMGTQDRKYSVAKEERNVMWKVDYRKFSGLEGIKELGQGISGEFHRKVRRIRNSQWPRKERRLWE